MINIKVNASRNYVVTVGESILSETGEYAVKEGLSGKAAIITDDNVFPLYSEVVKNSLLKSGFEVFEYVIRHGEQSKNAENFIHILNFLAENRFTRTDTVFALGGGVTGDLAGFCAAAYMRGINFVQLPTTLLAAVDSSVGGKTAIDLDCGKNLAGAFYQPRFVLFDMKTLETLPDIFFEDGMAEVIKYAMIYDKELFSLIEKEGKEALEQIIARCIEIKRDIVSEDECENGIRRILNFGHTVGHAIEKLSDYGISHGHAVAAGMYIITSAWEKRGLCKEKTAASLKRLLLKYKLPFITDYSSEEIIKACQNDKKLEGEKLNLVVISEIGMCSYVKTELSELKRLIEEGTECL